MTIYTSNSGVVYNVYTLYYSILYLVIVIASAVKRDDRGGERKWLRATERNTIIIVYNFIYFNYYNIIIFKKLKFQTNKKLALKKKYFGYINWMSYRVQYLHFLS